MKYPILSNCEISFIRLTLDFIYPPLPEGGVKLRPVPPYLRPYLWVAFFKFDGMQNRRLRIENLIGKFERVEGQEKHVLVRPPVSWVSSERFGHNNLGSTFMSDYPAPQIDYGIDYVSAKDLESIVTDRGSHVFRSNFGDLIPIPVKIINRDGSEIIPEFNVPGIIGCVAVLLNRLDLPNSAVLEGARAMIEALDDGLNQLIADYEFDFLQYIDDLLTGEESELITEESITALQQNIQNKVTQVIEDKVREGADWWEEFLWLIRWYKADDRLGTAFWYWSTEDLQGGNIQETQRRTKYEQIFQKEWLFTLLVESTDKYGHSQEVLGTSTLQLRGKVSAEKMGKVSAEKIKCFIATAAYGSTMYPRLNVLRNWRDKTLGKSRFGQELISLYNTSSPLLARIVGRSQVLRKIVRGILAPIICLIHRRHPSWSKYRSKSELE